MIDRIVYISYILADFSPLILLITENGVFKFVTINCEILDFFFLSVFVSCILKLSCYARYTFRIVMSS